MQANPSSSLKPLLFVLGGQQPPIDLQSVIQASVRGKENTEISRAAIELEKAITLINAAVGGACTSLQAMSALMLPEQLSIILWLAYLAFTKETEEIEEFDFIDKRNRTSWHVLQELANVNLLDWQTTLFAQLALTEIPREIEFPPGHPLPGRVYRQHPLVSFSNFYYPTQSFYSYIRDEREAELIHIMADLGANEIVIRDLSHDSLSTSHLADSLPIQTLHFPGKRWSPDIALEYSKYHWLPYETTWKMVIEERINHGCLEATIQIDIDFSRILIGQLSRIKNLINEFFSINPEFLDSSWHQVMQPRQVEIKFPQS
jgi:hypothetical protein